MMEAQDVLTQYLGKVRGGRLLDAGEEKALARRRADLLKCYSSCRRVRSPDPRASVGYEAFQDARV